MARHISTDRIKPENPSSVPAMISTLFDSTKPVAAAARPAYEFKSDITTGMSAEPMGITNITPNTVARPTIRKKATAAAGCSST